LAAGRIHHQFAACLAGCAVKLYSPTLELKISMDGVQRGINRELNLGLCRIQFEGPLLRMRETDAEQCGQYQQWHAPKNANLEEHQLPHS
jgi:hypothetical protein